jgi:Tfp pilus assembly protein PilO
MNPFDSTQLFGLFRRNLFATICTILSVLLASGLWILHQDVHSLEIVNRERSQEGAAMDSTLVTGPLIRQELAHAQEIMQRIESNLVIEKNLAENLWYFYKIHPDSKEILTSLRGMNSDPVPDEFEYKMVPFSLQLTGTYQQVAGYLLQLETGPRLVQVKSFSFRRVRQGAPGLVLNLEVRMLGKK